MREYIRVNIGESQQVNEGFFIFWVLKNSGFYFILYGEGKGVSK
jgi:hypothetical protein